MIELNVKDYLRVLEEKRERYDEAFKGLRELVGSEDGREVLMRVQFLALDIMDDLNMLSHYRLQSLGEYHGKKLDSYGYFLRDMLGSLQIFLGAQKLDGRGFGG